MNQSSRWPLLAAAFSDLGYPVVVVDTESTGGNFYSDRLTEIALLRFEGGNVVRYEQLVNPCRPIPTFVSHLTGITDEMVADAPVFGEIAQQVYSLLQGCILVAHNSRFDCTMLRHAFAREGISFSAPALCTVQLSRRLYPEFFKHNLDSMIQRMGIEVAQRHRAMTDVLAVCDFMELSLNERGRSVWMEQAARLVNPKMLPSWLAEDMRRRLHQLPDDFGVLLWKDAEGSVQYIGAHRRAYSETAELLHQKNLPEAVKSAVSVEFFPAVGDLHTLFIKAEVMQKHQIRPSESMRTITTVCFRPDEKGKLQAKTMPLKPGFFNQSPSGLFLNKKAAKTALLGWADEHSLCPAVLDILPYSLPKGATCPVALSGKCRHSCSSACGKEHHNLQVLNHAAFLPVADWGGMHEVEIVEVDEISGRKMSFRCKGGALRLSDEVWYFDEQLMLVLKNKFKKEKDTIRRIC